jgi:hypothetical protein
MPQNLPADFLRLFQSNLSTQEGVLFPTFTFLKFVYVFLIHARAKSSSIPLRSIPSDLPLMGREESAGCLRQPADASMTEASFRLTRFARMFHSGVGHEAVAARDLVTDLSISLQSGKTADILRFAAESADLPRLPHCLGITAS